MIDDALDAGIPLPALAAAATRAAQIVKPLQDAQDAAVAELEAALDAADAAVAECATAVAAAEGVPSPPAGPGPVAREGGRKAAKVDYAALSGGQNKKARAENDSALKAKAAAVASAVTARSALATRIEQRREWKKTAGPLTAAEF